jgi:hypothetical protein
MAEIRMSELQVGDWTVIADQIMEVTGFTPDGTVVVRPLAPSAEFAPTLQVGWAGEGEGEGVPMPPSPAGRPLLCDPATMERVEGIREAMRLAKQHPYRQIIFDLPPPEDP